MAKRKRGQVKKVAPPGWKPPEGYYWNGYQWKPKRKEKETNGSSKS